ncbi:MAG: TylF/MycF/NovP-related O-methyltransferase [Myxococcota bacterium]
MPTDDELIDELRHRGYFVAPLRPMGDIPDRDAYRPYFSGTEVFMPAFTSPLIDATVRRLVELGKQTMVTQPKQWILLRCLAQVARVPGEVWELGVYQGGTALLLRNAMQELGLAPAARLRLFDTFEGMPETDPSLDLHHAGDFRDTSLEEVRRVVGEADFVSYHPGLVPETLVGLEASRIRLAHIDLDIHASITASLEFVYPRLSEGGALVFDDYGVASCPGARRAVDEFFEARPETPIDLPTGQALVFKLPVVVADPAQ